MADIFISYAREDIERVRPIVEELEMLGWSVFWDTKIQPGDNWPIEITEALKSSRCVLVLWSVASADFKIHHWIWVEAEFGRKKGILVPLLLDDVEIPIEFSHVQSVDLSRWEKNTSDPEFQKLVNALSSKILSASSQNASVFVSPYPAIEKQRRVAGKRLKTIGCSVSFTFIMLAISVIIQLNPASRVKSSQQQAQIEKAKLMAEKDLLAARQVVARAREEKKSKVILIQGADTRKAAMLKLEQEAIAKLKAAREAASSKPTILKIGDDYGGGKIAFIDATGKHGLIASKVDLPGGSIYSWEAAKKVCRDLVENGYSDWYLPSKDELDKLFFAKSAVGGFAPGAYFSSTEISAYYAWGRSFDDERHYYIINKSLEWRVRPVRCF